MGCGALRPGRLTWSQCPSLAESCGRTLFIRFGGNLGEPGVQLASRERRGDCRREGTWLLAAWLILSRQVPLAGPEDRHESRLRKAVTSPSAPRLSRSRSGSLARSPSLSLLRSFACASLLPPRQISSQPWGPGARQRANGVGSPSAPRSLGGERGGRATPGEGLTRRRAKMNGGAGRGGGGGWEGRIPGTVYSE